MTSERFNELLRGPLAHPIAPLTINRLVMALWSVVNATGDAGAAALEAYCRERDARDWADEAFPAEDERP